MRLPGRHRTALGLWLLLTAAGAAALARLELARLQDLFETDARIAHRVLSQRVVQHEAVLATVALLQPAAGAEPVERRLPALYPQILSVQRRERDAGWNDPALAAAEARSRAAGRPALADADFARGRYRVVLAAEPASFSAQFELQKVVPWNEWPMDPATSPLRVALEYGGQQFLLQPGSPAPGLWTLSFRKHLAAESQPFDLVARRTVGWGDLPWRWILPWALAMAAAVAAWHWLRTQRAERRRAEELLRLGQVARLNTLGELAAGMAHELNQPLAAVLASTQAARRLLQEDAPELATARDAMRQAEQQARRAADVLGRLRRGVERPAAQAALQPVVLSQAVRNALYLLEPEFARRQVAPQLETGEDVAVQAEPVALEQIIHNLLTNALQALEQVPPQERSLSVRVEQESGQGALTVGDSGPGIAPEVLPRIFEPFFTTRENGLGLGLSLCESLATGMGGRLGVQARSPRGAAFTLRLPLVEAP
ncbi:MAG TPA: ATP-binding protein [Ramlibacter sp.]|uniref:sensor histidine kinase n=1 Tax=Ramlibacter sp. TaxID=1917967 RepID=UPI002D7F6AC3|nr:ATP-binding protein [Ramlibacter sp.]HET8748787.1 ATP-binding protein [Ramlibacter sp.]